MTDQPERPDLEVNLPMPGGLAVAGEQPYRILMVSDFAGSKDGAVSGPLAEGVVDVTADTFDQVMAQAAPRVDYKTEDPVASGSVMAEVHLRFDSIKAFKPDAVMQQIPAAGALADVRGRIAARLRGELEAAELASAVQHAASEDSDLAWLVDAVKPGMVEETAAPEAVDGLLDQLDLGGDKPDKPAKPAKSPIGSLVSAAAGTGGSIPAGESSSLRKTLVEIDRRISAWLSAVMHAPQFQKVESAWRSLAFLVSKIEFRKGIHLSILHAPADEVVDRFVSAVIDPVFDEGAAAPDFIAVDSQFGSNAADMEALDGLAQHAASLPAVVVAGVSPNFFGVKHAWQISTLPPIVSMFDQWQFAKWKGLRDEPYAKSLGVVFGRCLLRSPYEKKDAGGPDFAFNEKSVTEKDFLWGPGSMVAACAVAGSVARTGWPSAMAGHVHGRVEGFPVVLHAGPKGDKKFGPSDAQIPQTKIEEMGAGGVNAAAVLSEGQDVLLWNGLTAARPVRMDPNSLLEVSLPYNLFAGRLSTLLLALKPHLAGLAPEKVCAKVLTHVRTWLNLGDQTDTDQVSAQVRPDESAPGSQILAVTVTPPGNIVPGGIPVVLGFRLT